MKITVPLNAATIAQLNRLRLKRKARLQDLISEALRRGLQDMAATTKKPKQFRTRSFDGGRLLIDNIDCVGAILVELDAEKYLGVEPVFNSRAASR